MRIALAATSQALLASAPAIAQQPYRLQVATELAPVCALPATARAAIGAGAGELTHQNRRRQGAARQQAFAEGVQAGKQQARKY